MQRQSPSSLVFACVLTCANFSFAQTGAPAAKPAASTPVATSQPASRSNQLIERIHVEGGSTQIDEVRMGGETRSITVQPKGGMPAYDVQPATGARAWKLFGF